MALTLSNVITDAIRTAALAWAKTQQGGSTDGATEPGGVGVWEAGTNLHPRGQCDTNNNYNATGSGTTTRATDATVQPPWSTQSIKVTVDGTSAQQGVAAQSATGQAAAAGVLDVGSILFQGAAGQSYKAAMRWGNTDSTSTEGTIVTFTAGSGAWPTITAHGETWEVITPAALAVAAGKTGDYVAIRVFTATARAESFWVAHPMLQKGVNVVSPYVATSGGATATRAAARVQAPATLLNSDGTQGWFAAHLQMGWGVSAPPGGGTGSPRVFEWKADSNNRLALYYSESRKTFSIDSIVGGVFKTANSAVQSFAAGTTVTVVWFWTATQIGVSVNGSAFVVTARTTVPSGLPSTFDIGSAEGAGAYLDSTMLWEACGTGTLTNADAAAIADLSASDPDFDSLGIACSMVWPAVDSSYVVAPTNVELPVAA